MRTRLILLFSCVALVAPSAQAADDSVNVTAGKVDAQLRAAWAQASVTPAPRTDDARFLRRASLDLTGSLPAPQEITQFLDDPAPDKRARAIDRLLESSAYGDHWADYWDAILMGRLTREAYLDRAAFHKWLSDQFTSNVPWDKFVYSLISATGFNTNRIPKNAASNPEDQQQRFNPATNWFLRYSKALPELAGTTSRVFLGVQIQFAQCHDHKTEAWKKSDFRQFTAFFTKTWGTYYDKRLIVGINRQDTKDWPYPAPVNGKFADYFASYKDYVSSKPRFLQGAEYEGSEPPRTALARWVTARDNPWFAKAIVNRVWSHLMGRGFVEPIDDFRPGNPPIMGQTLDLLADDFASNGYDLRRLFRVICRTEAYQLACRASSEKGTAGNPQLWSAYPIKQLELETQLDVLLQATGGRQMLDKLSGSKVGLIRTSILHQFVIQLGTDDMAEATSSGETVPHAMLLLNGALVNGLTRVTPGLALDEVLKTTTEERARIEQLYLRTMSRRPTPRELAAWTAFLNQPRDLVHTKGPGEMPPVGAAAREVAPEIASAPENTDFKELLKFAKSPADIKALSQRMRSNADAGLFVKALEAWAADYPVSILANMGGGASPQEQAYEDLFFALINGTEFLTNH